MSSMGPGKAFELFVKRILIHIGFSEVVSDGLYIYDGAPGQMIQGLGEAHNADVWKCQEMCSRETPKI